MDVIKKIERLDYGVRPDGYFKQTIKEGISEIKKLRQAIADTAPLEEVLTLDQSIDFLNKLLEKPNGATPYKSYINDHLAKDFAVDIVKAILRR